MISLMRRVVFTVVVVVPLTVFAEAPAKEALCRSCHGKAGAAPIMPAYPKLAGQNKAYLVSAIKAYRDGERKTGMAAVMAASAMGLTDADIEALADYYSSQ